MPEWVVYLAVIVVLTGVLFWVVAGSLLAIAGARRAGDAVRRLTTPDSALWVQCDQPRCGHMQTVHEVTAEGLRCSVCGHVLTSE
ncbi:hypothetical protein ACFWNI_33640 [Streptomyces sp. NPDC058377]|uniref:hypothetical protein n=1 Tax=Streptomyces sp. NPDC058377 TaxID=3346468 RepID=UPI00366634FD